MKQIMEFNLPDDESELIFAFNGRKYWLTLIEINDRIRTWNKYDDREDIPADEIREMFFEVLESNGVNLDDIK